MIKRYLIIMLSILLLGIGSATAQEMPSSMPNPLLRLDAIPQGDVAAHFALPDAQDKIHSLKDYAGKYLIVSFWSSSCNHCLKDLASLSSVYHILKKHNYEVVSIHAGEPPDEKFMKLNNFAFTTLYDIDLSMRHWSIPAIPTAYIIAPNKQRIYRAVGARHWSDKVMLNQLIDIAKGQKVLKK